MNKKLINMQIKCLEIMHVKKLDINKLCEQYKGKQLFNKLLDLETKYIDKEEYEDSRKLFESGKELSCAHLHSQGDCIINKKCKCDEYISHQELNDSIEGDY